MWSACACSARAANVQLPCCEREAQWLLDEACPLLWSKGRYRICTPSKCICSCMSEHYTSRYTQIYAHMQSLAEYICACILTKHRQIHANMISKIQCIILHMWMCEHVCQMNIKNIQVQMYHWEIEIQIHAYAYRTVNLQYAQYYDLRTVSDLCAHACIWGRKLGHMQQFMCTICAQHMHICTGWFAGAVLLDDK